jgi:hypothetical protein
LRGAIPQAEEWGSWADHEIARRCAVHHEIVGRVRAEHLAETPNAARTVSRGGTVCSLDAGRIGRQQPETDSPAQDSAPAPGTLGCDAIGGDCVDVAPIMRRS